MTLLREENITMFLLCSTRCKIVIGVGKRTVLCLRLCCSCHFPGIKIMQVFSSANDELADSYI